MSLNPPDESRRLLAVVPCLNEENTIARVVSAIPRQLDGFAQVDVLVIDDGSTDATATVAEQAGAEVLRHGENKGLGVSFREAIELAISRDVSVAVHIDGDGQFDPRDIPKLIEPIVERRADMVTASRFLRADIVPQMPRVKRWGNRGVAFIVYLLTGKKFRDVSCGFRAYSREALLRMNLFGSFTYTQEVFLDLIFKDLVILEVPVRVRGVREFGDSRVASSIPRYALRSLQIMLRAFISYRPFSLFFALSSVFFLIGFVFLAFLGMHYFDTGAFTPHIWAGFVGGSFAFLSLTTLVTGLIGDMLVRIRLTQEMILYRQRRAEQRLHRKSGSG